MKRSHQRRAATRMSCRASGRIRATSAPDGVRRLSHPRPGGVRPRRSCASPRTPPGRGRNGLPGRAQCGTCPGGRQPRRATVGDLRRLAIGVHQGAQPRCRRDHAQAGQETGADARLPQRDREHRPQSGARPIRPRGTSSVYHPSFGHRGAGRHARITPLRARVHEGSRGATRRRRHTAPGGSRKARRPRAGRRDPWTNISMNLSRALVSVSCTLPWATCRLLI